MSDFEYTEVTFPNSSLVEGVYFNENDNYVALDLNGRFYRYDNVDSADVEELTGAASVGGRYATWKHEHGPGTFLGYWHEVDFDEVRVLDKTVTDIKTAPSYVQNEWTDATVATREVSLQSPVAAVEEAYPEAFNNDEEPTKEVSLQPVQSESEVNTYRVDFVANGSEREHVVKTTTLSLAVDEVQSFADALGVSIEIVGANKIG